MSLRRVCVEFMAPAELARPEVLALLLPRRIAPMLAMRGADDEAALESLRPYADAGLPACAWPLLSDEDGYWPGVANAGRFARRAADVASVAARIELALPWLAVDLEPPIDAVLRARRANPVVTAAALLRRALDGSRARFVEAEAHYAALQRELMQCNIRTLAIAYPIVTADLAHGSSRALERLCDAPVRAGWDHVAVLAFGSMLAGLSGGVLDAADARWYAFRALSQLGRAVGPRAGAFVGVVGRGKLGDEPSWSHPAELSRDVAAMRAAGIDDLNLFCLEGVLDSPHPEAWLDALVHTPSIRPPFSLRGELLHRSISIAARVLPG